jgi:N-succinyldiaminopimelate aminotransferase
MNPRLGLLQPYPFEKLRDCSPASPPPAGLAPISLGLGEPQHPTPQLLKTRSPRTWRLARYPLTLGLTRVA